MPQPALPKCRRRLPALARGRQATCCRSVLPRGLHCRRRSARSPTNKSVRLSVVVRGRRRDAAHHRRRGPKHLGATIGATLVLHVGLGDDAPPSTCTASSPVAACRPTGNAGSACRRGFFLPVRVLSRLFRRRFPGRAGEGASTLNVLRFFGSSPRWHNGRVPALARAAAHEQMGRLCQTRPFAGPGGARLPVALHPSGGDLEPSPQCRSTPAAPSAGLPRWGRAMLFMRRILLRVLRLLESPHPALDGLERLTHARALLVATPPDDPRAIAVEPTAAALSTTPTASCWAPQLSASPATSKITTS